jgi:hypothetical protein
MAAPKATFLYDLAEVSKDVGRPLVAFVFVVVLVTSLRYLPHVAWPERDVKVLSLHTDTSDGELSITDIELWNGSSFDLKDPEISCDMKGPSGTVIRKGSKVIYEVLPSEKSRSFNIMNMAPLPDQATKFSCHVKNVSVKW